MNADRDASLLMIVERDADLENVERSSAYEGLYFVLGGSIPSLTQNPHSRVRSRELLDVVRDRGKEGYLKEIIIATNANPDGDNTASFVVDFLSLEQAKAFMEALSEDPRYARLRDRNPYRRANLVAEHPIDAIATYAAGRREYRQLLAGEFEVTPETEYRMERKLREIHEWYREAGLRGALENPGGLWQQTVPSFTRPEARADRAPFPSEMGRPGEPLDQRPLRAEAREIEGSLIFDLLPRRESDIGITAEVSGLVIPSVDVGVSRRGFLRRPTRRVCRGRGRELAVQIQGDCRARQGCVEGRTGGKPR